MILGSSNIIPYINKIGYMPYNEGFDSDHRTMFCDLSKDILNVKDNKVEQKFRMVGTNSTNQEGLC
jgi:hypothetical protein